MDNLNWLQWSSINVFMFSFIRTIIVGKLLDFHGTAIHRCPSSDSPASTWGNQIALQDYETLVSGIQFLSFGTSTKLYCLYFIVLQYVVCCIYLQCYRGWIRTNSKVKYSSLKRSVAITIAMSVAKNRTMDIIMNVIEPGSVLCKDIWSVRQYSIKG